MEAGQWRRATVCGVGDGMAATVEPSRRCCTVRDRDGSVGWWCGGGSTVNLVSRAARPTFSLYVCSAAGAHQPLLGWIAPDQGICEVKAQVESVGAREGWRSIQQGILHRITALKSSRQIKAL